MNFSIFRFCIAPTELNKNFPFTLSFSRVSSSLCCMMSFFWGEFFTYFLVWLLRVNQCCFASFAFDAVTFWGCSSGVMRLSCCTLCFKLNSTLRAVGFTNISFGLLLAFTHSLTQPACQPASQRSKQKTQQTNECALISVVCRRRLWVLQFGSVVCRYWCIGRHFIGFIDVVVIGFCA